MVWDLAVRITSRTPEEVKQMKALKYLIVIASPLLFVAGCETVNQNDKALLEKASANAADAKAASMKASSDAKAAAAAAKAAAAAAKAAAAAARAAADAANRGAAEAKAAGDKADRIFQKNLRK